MNAMVAHDAETGADLDLFSSAPFTMHPALCQARAMHLADLRSRLFISSPDQPYDQYDDSGNNSDRHPHSASHAIFPIAAVHH